jgi:hypothetical protein
MCCPRHFGGLFEFSLNGSTGAAFFLGVSEFRLNISTSALFFFVPSGLVGSGNLALYSS